MALRRVLDKQTGQILQVPDEQLGKYGIGVAAQPQSGGYALPQYQQDLQSDIQRTGGKHVQEIKAYYDAMNPAGAKTPAQTAKDINMGKSGLRSLQTVADEYQKDPDVLTKQLLPGKFLTRKFDSALFNTVDAILRARTGAQANKDEIAAYLNEKGPSFGDSPEVVQYKLNAIQQDLADAAGVKDVQPIVFRGKGATVGPSLGGLLGNAGQDTKDLLNGILNIPAQGINTYKQALSGDKKAIFAVLNMGNPAAIATKTGQAVLSEGNQLLGDPLAGGDIIGRIGDRAYKKPVTTLLDVLPALQAGKAAIGAKAAAGVEEAATGAKAITDTARAALSDKDGRS
jgi:hypothetical protein